MPISSETKVAPVTSTRVSIISFHRPRFRISSRPSEDEQRHLPAALEPRWRAMRHRAEDQGIDRNRARSTSPSIGMRRPFGMPSNNHSKFVGQPGDERLRPFADRNLVVGDQFCSNPCHGPPSAAPRPPRPGRRSAARDTDMPKTMTAPADESSGGRDRSCVAMARRAHIGLADSPAEPSSVAAERPSDFFTAASHPGRRWW